VDAIAVVVNERMFATSNSPSEDNSTANDWMMNLATLPYQLDTTSTYVERTFTATNDGVVMTTLTCVLTAILELTSYSSVRTICRGKGGANLYAQGVLMNILNNCVLGPIAYVLCEQALPCAAIGHRQ
jgi:hypothetical protein